MNRFFTAAALAALLCGCNSDGTTDVEQAAPQKPPALVLPSVEIPPYELIQNSGPLVILMATDMNATLYGGVMDGIPADLANAGFSLLSLDLPCHGASPDGTGTLGCWRTKIAGGDTEIFKRYCAGLSLVLDELGVTEASVVGQSRGGYVAVTCAAYDQRIKHLALVVPVTDLQRLYEFDGYIVDQTVFGLSQYLPYLTDRDILVRIGDEDDRVGSDSAVKFSNAVMAELQLIHFAGHGLPNDGSAMRWLIDHT